MAAYMIHHPALTVTLLITGMLLVAGCVTPYDIGGADRRVTPSEAAKDVAGLLNPHVAWGGEIAAVKNLKNTTELEVVGYPLDSLNRPERTAAPIGRFILIQSGYLETVDYAPGRLITAVGMVKETRRGSVGEANYLYPLLMAEKLQLWPRPVAERREPTVHFGIGVGISR